MAQVELLLLGLYLPDNSPSTTALPDLERLPRRGTECLIMMSLLVLTVTQWTQPYKPGSDSPSYKSRSVIVSATAVFQEKGRMSNLFIYFSPSPRRIQGGRRIH